MNHSDYADIDRGGHLKREEDANRERRDYARDLAVSGMAAKLENPDLDPRVARELRAIIKMVFERP